MAISSKGLPFHHLYSDEITSIPAVEEDESIWRGSLELEEKVHGCVSLQGR